MSDFDDAVAGLRAQRPQFTDPRIKVTGYRFPDGTVGNDPTEGAQPGYLWVYGYPRPGANTQVIAGTRVNPRVPNVKVWVGQNHAKQAVAFDVVTDENAIRQFGGAVGAASTPLIPIEQWTQPVPGGLIGGGRLLPSTLGGLNVFIEGLVGFGWDGNDLPVDAGDIPPNPNEHGWAVWYLPPYSGTPVVPDYLLTTPVTVSSINFLLVSDAYNLALPAGATRLAAVSLSYGQSIISGATSRFVDLRRDFVPEWGVYADPTGAASGDVPTWDSGTETWVVAPQTGGTGGAGAYILIQEQQAQNTSGGTFTSGAWQTRALNTEVADGGGHASLSASQITLAAGTYELDYWAVANAVGSHQARFWNVTDSSLVALSNPGFADTGVGRTDNTVVLGDGIFTIASPKVFELQHQCGSTKTTDGFGLAANFDTEIYSSVTLRKVS